MITCIVVDDEQHAIDVLKAHIAMVADLEIKLATQRSIEAYQYIQKHPVDLIYLDIQMPDLDGLQFLKMLKGRAEVILTTAFKEHALAGFDFDVLDYLLKPILFDRFLKATQKAMNTIELKKTKRSGEKGQEAEYIFVKTGTRKQRVKISLSDIQYIESKGNYAQFHMESEKLMALISLKELMELLPERWFIRVHLSYIISIAKIKSIEGNSVRFRSGLVPIGPTYRISFNARIQNL